MNKLIHIYIKMSISGGFDGASRHFEKKKKLLISIYKTFDVHYTYRPLKTRV